MSRGMTRQRDELHAVDDWLGAAKRVPLTGLDVRRCDGLRTLKERLRILRRLSSDVRRQPKVAFGLRDVNIGIRKDALSVLSGQAADVIGMEVCEQNKVDFFGRIACAAEAAAKRPSAPPPHQMPAPASTRISCLPVLTRKPVSTTSSMCGSSCSPFTTPSIVAFVPFSQCGSNTPVPSYRAVTSRSPTFSRKKPGA